MILILKLLLLKLRAIYFFLKLLPTQNKVVFISRFSDTETLDFQLLRKEIGKQYPKLKIVSLMKKIPENRLGKILYAFYMFKKMYHLATSKICIVDSYIITVSVLNHKKDLQIIQIWHALGAIKQFGYQVLDKPDGYPTEVAMAMKMHRNYDYVICSGPGTIPHYEVAFNTPKERILPLGMPRVDYLREQRNVLNEDLVKDYPVVKEKINIVYVPTFRKNRELELEGLISAVDYSKYNLILKPHPNEPISIDDDRVILDYTYPSMEWMKYADYIITDYSAVAFEAMILDKPLLFYLFDYEQYKEETGLNIDWMKEIPEYSSKDGKKIVEIIQSGGYDKKIYTNLRKKYLSAVENNCTAEIVKLFEIK